MKAWMYTIYLKTRMDWRSSEIWITHFLVPIVFFFVMGAVFTSVMPETEETLIPTMVIFTATMGALIGTSGTLLPYTAAPTRKSMKAGGIPFSSVLLATLVAGIVNLLLVSVFIFLVAPLVFGADLPASFGVFIGGFFLFLVPNLLLAILIAVLAKDASRLTIVSQAVFLPSMLLSGIMFPFEMLPTPLAAVGYALPATHAMMIMTEESFPLVNVLVLAAFIPALLFLIGVRLRALLRDEG